MKHVPKSLPIVLVLAFILSTCAAEEYKLEQGFVRLDNGTDLKGWFGAQWSGRRMPDHTGWRVVNGAIHLDSKAAKCHLFSEKKYNRSVIIRLQFRAALAADSGLNVHGKQFQVRDYVGSPLADTRRYAFACKSAGKWNDLELDVTEGVAVVRLNAKVIEKAWPVGEKSELGLGLQREKGDFEFRRIRIKEKEEKK